MPVILKANLSDYPHPDPIFRHLLTPPCAACGLSPLRMKGCSHKVVPPIGNIRKAKIGLWFQSPGETEDFSGFPLSGPYHYVLLDFAKALGFPGLTKEFWDLVVVANAVWCHPENNRGALARELDACRANANLLMQHMDLRLAVLVGQDALSLFEGRDAKLSFRAGSPGCVTWRDTDGKVLRTFRTYPMRHPGFIRQIENNYGQRKAHKDYESAVAWVGRAGRLIQKGQDTLSDPGYVYNFCETEMEALEQAEAFRDANYEHVALDFETWALQVRKEAVGLALSPAPHTAFYFPLKQCIATEKPSLIKYKGKLRKVPYALAPYFSEGFEKRLFEILRPVFEGENRPYLTAQHAQIEMSCLSNYGIKMLPKPEQLLGDPEIPAFDTMLLARNVLQTNRVNLETILQVAMPLEYTRKNFINEQITEPDMHATGFGLFSIKPPDSLQRLDRASQPFLGKDKKLDWWCEEAQAPKIQVLAERAMNDADWERRLAYILAEMAFSEDLKVNVDVEQLFQYQRDDE